MATSGELGFTETFETLRPSHPLFCHQEFLEKLAEHNRDPIGRRAAFLMQRLLVDARRLHYKATQGVNRGWRRSRLGGNHGSHFYAWWAPKSALPLKEWSESSDMPDGAICLRDIRHHDDHSLLSPQSFACYMPMTVRDLRREEYAPFPLTPPQARFASARQPIRLLKGHPGSGKTTALWHAADSSGAERILYVTYSPDLAALAREYFDRFCSSQKRFSVITFPNLVRQILGTDVPVALERESRERFRRDLAPFARSLGAWATSHAALYDEFYAHLIGDALPIAVGRFAACKQLRCADKSYRERRTRFLGQGPAASVLEAAERLERLDSASLGERYFPELALAWRAVERLHSNAAKIDPALLDFDCFALDECQDLTPIEALLVVELASRINHRHRAPLLLAGDEAQTVRPTDFEWGWLSDLLHTRLSTPSEYKLSANLRSPRRIAELVNRVWDLYALIQKQDRPSGTGYAEIDDDATDQILYCSATAGADLNDLLVALSTREGLALIALDDTVPAYVPEAARRAVLTVSEAKGLDFHSVCVLDGGRHIERIVRNPLHLRADSDIEELRKRLAIDQLRVALSRPAERLFWLDVNPTNEVVRQSLTFLNGRDAGGVSSCVPAALLKTLEEDDLVLEERVQRCQSDARQYLQVKPEMAWSRAQQGVALLGPPGGMMAVTDEAARAAAYLTLAEVCFTLGVRNARLPPELGRPDLFLEAHRAAVYAGRPGLAGILVDFGRVHHAGDGPASRLNALVDLSRSLPRHKEEIEPWLRVELAARSTAWAELLEGTLTSSHNAGILLNLAAGFYEALEIPDRIARTQRLQQRAVQLLFKDKQFAVALAALRAFPERQPKLEAICLEGLGDFRAAAQCHLSVGNPKEALNCYRSIPDLEAALKLIDEIGDHPAGESLRWMSKLREMVAERPEKFIKTVTPAEKRLLEEMLERALGVSRRKPTPRKTVRKKAAAPRKRVSKAPV